MLRNLVKSDENRQINIELRNIGRDVISRISKAIDVKTAISTKISINITIEANIFIICRRTIRISIGFDRDTFIK